MGITRSEKIASKCFIIRKKRKKENKYFYFSPVWIGCRHVQCICQKCFKSCSVSILFGTYDNEYFDFSFSNELHFVT